MCELSVKTKRFLAREILFLLGTFIACIVINWLTENSNREEEYIALMYFIVYPVRICYYAGKWAIKTYFSKKETI